MFSRDNIKTLRNLVYTAADRFGDEPFFRTRVKKDFIDKTFNEFKHDVNAVAAWFEDEFGREVHSAIFGATSYEFLLGWFGAALSGNVSVPLAVGNSVEALADEINRSDSEVIFIDEKREDCAEELKKLCPQVKVIVHMHSDYPGTTALSDILEKYAGREPKTEITPDMLAAIIFTSGTTGQSKGVMLTHSNFADNATCEPDRGYHGHRRLSILPIHHIFCFTCDILAALWYGRTVCVNDSLMRIPKNLQAYKPHETTFVPMIAASILNKMRQEAKKNPDKKAVGREMFGEDFDVLFAGGAYLSPEIIKGYAEFGIELAQGYGMTETTSRISTGVKNCPYPESVGRIVAGCEVKIVDGEIWARSPSIMKGYYKNSEETAKALTDDGWLMTGDLGYVHDGYVFISGRKKNLIILDNGENVSPEELENMFATFEPIKELVVYDKDGVITAQIYANPDYESDDIQAEIQSEVDRVNDTLPAAKQIHRVVYRDGEFEKTSSKKIKRGLVEKL